MTTGSRDEGGNDPNQVIVHVTRISECLGARSHNSRDLGYLKFNAGPSFRSSKAHQLIRLIEGGCLLMQSIGRDSSQGTIIEDHDCISIVHQSLES